MEIGFLNLLEDKQVVCRNLVFVLLKPDVFLRGLLYDILQFIQENQFHIIEYFCAYLPSVHYDLMYGSTFNYEVDDWFHNQQIFRFGPALGLLLFRASDEENAITYFSKIKGSALPRKREPCTFRAIFGSKSRTFNLIHVADYYEQSLKEAYGWFGDLKFSFLMQKLKDNIFISIKTLILEISMHGYCLENHLDPEVAFVRSKIRLFHSLRKNCILQNKEDIFFFQLQCFYNQWEKEILQSSLLGDIEGTIIVEWKDKESFFINDAINRLHLSVMSISQKNEILNILEYISKFSNNNKYPYQDNYIMILNKWKVYNSELERYMIISRLKYQ